MVLRVPRPFSVRVRNHCAKTLSFWNLRNRHANSIMPRLTRALPERVSPFSRRNITDIDRTEIRVAAVRSHASTLALTRILRQAKLVYGETIDPAFDLLRNGNADVHPQKHDQENQDRIEHGPHDVTNDKVAKATGKDRKTVQKAREGDGRRDRISRTGESRAEGSRSPCGRGPPVPPLAP
jgi:hypothetical protein